MIKTFNWF